MDNQTKFDTEIFEVYNVHGYADNIGTVHLLIDDVAVGLGIVQVKKDRVLKRGDKYYTAIRRERINKYLRDFGCLGKDAPDVESGDYIPEQWFYFLAMKANNEAAKKFRKKIAYEIMPALRKHGYYSLTGEPVLEFDFASLQVQIDELKIAIATLAESMKSATAVTKPVPVVLPEEPTDIFRIYAYLLSDGNVKIGCTKRFIQRAGEVERETGLKIADVYFTPEMSYKNAHLIEWCSKKSSPPSALRAKFFRSNFLKLTPPSYTTRSWLSPLRRIKPSTSSPTGNSTEFVGDFFLQKSSDRAGGGFLFLNQF